MLHINKDISNNNKRKAGMKIKVRQTRKDQLGIRDIGFYKGIEDNGATLVCPLKWQAG